MRYYGKIHSKLPNFRVKSEKFTPAKKNLHEYIRGVRDKYEVWVSQVQSISIFQEKAVIKLLTCFSHTSSHMDTSSIVDINFARKSSNQTVNLFFSHFSSHGHVSWIEDAKYVLTLFAPAYLGASKDLGGISALLMYFWFGLGSKSFWK